MKIKSKTKRLFSWLSAPELTGSRNNNNNILLRAFTQSMECIWSDEWSSTSPDYHFGLFDQTSGQAHLQTNILAWGNDRLALTSTAQHVFTCDFYHNVLYKNGTSTNQLTQNYGPRNLVLNQLTVPVLTRHTQRKQKLPTPILLALK